MADPEVLTKPDLLLVEGRETRKVARPGTARRYARLVYWIALSDALALELAIVLTRLIKTGFKPYGLDFVLLLEIAPVVWVAIFAAFRLYGLSRLSPAEEFRRIVEATGVALGVKLMLSLLFPTSSASPLSRGWVGLTWFIALILVLVERQLWHKYMGRLRLSGELSYRTVIVGANQEGATIAETLRHKSVGFHPVGMVRTSAAGSDFDGLPPLGSAHELGRIIEDHGIECVFLASSAVGPELMKRMAKQLRQHDVEVRVSANLTDILASRLTVQPVGDLLALSLRPVRLSGFQAMAKRSFDLVVAGAAVLLSSPLWLMIAVLVKATSRGPVLFKQQRVGRNSNPFTIYKFRSMVRGAEVMIHQLKDRNEASGPLFKMREDPRVTTVGRWLRRWSLDELPQLLNVLKGDMSLVGPRPPLPEEVATYEDWHRERLEVSPGLTGLWQVGGRSELGFDDLVRLDLFYIENWSITYDLFILAKTIPAVLSRKGAF